jgi:hypothetical protein
VQPSSRSTVEGNGHANRNAWWETWFRGLFAAGRLVPGGGMPALLTRYRRA